MVPQPTTCDHINIKYVWGPHCKPYGDHVNNIKRFAKSLHIKFDWIKKKHGKLKKKC